MVSMFVFASFKGDKTENHNINSLVDIMDVLKSPYEKSKESIIIGRWQEPDEKVLQRRSLEAKSQSSVSFS